MKTVNVQLKQTSMTKLSVHYFTKTCTVFSKSIRAVNFISNEVNVLFWDIEGIGVYSGAQ